MPTTNLLDVSVVTPAYNCSKTILATIESVANQTSSVREHIIVDDGSTDGTLDMLHEYAEKHSWLKILNQKNKGAGYARNLAIEAAKGKYIAFLDSDDLWLPEKIRTQVAHMESTTSVLSYGDYTEFDSVSGRPGRHFSLPNELSYDDLLRGCPIGCLTVAYDQSELGKCYMPAVRRGQDWGLWLQITRSGARALKYPGNLALYSVSPVSLSKNKIKKALDVYKIYWRYEKIGALRSLYFLFKHIQYVKNKREMHDNNYDNAP
ncbi:glycosyltransferase family 2 protein [Alloalcanivorax xenomutans]|uniref:glycosyltransferase family 2 protein n=1 Tax=Alloalcanivorax xenomutans TaxID=1094342 RepID=UPI0009B69C4E|nr:glycosyltransferase family 2 protein [Alloalcanivorax xenomutans]